jgi:transcriptional regulator with XRE-family HTH domain
MARKGPNSIDVHVGERVRLRRTLLGMSQEKLASRLGITFQQVQKYEKGTNRVGAGRLKQIADVLEVPVGYFYEDLPSESRGAGLREADRPFEADALATGEGLELNKAFLRIADPKVRRKIVELVRVLAGDK